MANGRNLYHRVAAAARARRGAGPGRMRGARRGGSLSLEPLEPRLLLSIAPNPIVPSTGEGHLLDLVAGMPINDIYNALDHFPVPYTIVAQAGDADPVVENWKAGNAFMQIDVDGSKATGKGGGGNDLMVNVQTELEPTPHLLLTIERLGDSSFVEDVEVLIAFPFEAFTDEDLPGEPNLFIGYQTTAAGGAVGGHVPLRQEIRFLPGSFDGTGTLGGTDHLFDLVITTEGDDNPLTFLAGHFDGDYMAGILNASAIAAHVETADHTVPDSITIGLDVDELLPLGGPTVGSDFGLVWDASEPADVTFGYVEDESSAEGVADFDTALVFSQMPTHEELSFHLSENPGFTLSHRSDAPIGSLALRHTREDGLLILGSATDVPTEVDLSIALDGSAFALDVNDNTMDLQVELLRDGGFLATEAMLGFDLGYLGLRVEDVPDLTAGYNAAESSFTVAATNPGESIPLIEAILDDDAYYDDTDALVGLQLAPGWADTPLHHVFSLIEDGQHGTAAARLVHTSEATYDLDGAGIGTTFEWGTTQAAAMQMYLAFGVGSNLIDGDPNLDIEITGDILDIPAGHTTFYYEAPIDFGYTTDPPTGIDLVHFVGHVGNTNFDLLAGGLPPVFGFSFDPAGSVTVLAEDGFGGSDTVGVLAARVWAPEDGDPLPDTDGLFGVPLRDARVRIDDIPSSNGTWQNDAAGAVVAFDTVGDNAFLGGAQIAVSTLVEFHAPLPEAGATSEHYAELLDKGLDTEGEPIQKRLTAGVFGVDEFSLDTTGSITVHYETNGQRVMTVDIDRAFAGAFFPAGADYDYDLTLTIDRVPTTLDFTSDLTTSFSYSASHGIDAITLVGSVDDTDDDEVNGTEIDIELLGLPSEVAFALDPSAGATLTMNGSLDSIALSFTSQADSTPVFSSLFASEFRLIEAEITDVPAHWTANWSGGGFLLEAKDTGDNTAPMGTLTARLSTSKNEADNTAKLQPFTENGPVHTGHVLDGSNGSRIEYSAFLQEIDYRYYSDSGATSVFSRLREIYAGSEELDPGEDHAIVSVLAGEVDFVSIQFTGFQALSWAPDAGGGEFVFRAPSPGDHPLFAAFAEDGVATTMQIQNVPDQIVVHIDMVAQFIHYDATDDVDPSAGDIDLYQGPLPYAGEGDDAMRVVLLDAPEFVHIDWALGTYDGGINFDAKDTFELLFLQQGGGTRITAGLEMEDLSLGYNVDLFPLTVEIEYDELTGLIPVGVDLRLLEASATINGSPGVNGFLTVNQWVSSPFALNTGTPPNGGEYIPAYSFLLNDFREFSITLGVDVELFPVFLSPDIDLDWVLDGQLMFDVWSHDDTDWTFTIDIEVETWTFGFENPPDYTDNTPIHIYPFTGGLWDWFSNPYSYVFTFVGFHNFSHHFNPYA